MSFDIKKVVAARQGENYELHEKYVNRTLVKVQRTIGFDKVYARAEGCYLYDREGHEFLDFISGYGVFNIGRNHPDIKKVIRDTLDLDLPNMVQMDCALLSGLLGEAVVQRTGPNLDACFFCNSGAEAVEGAIKFAKCATKKSRILSLSSAFHGLSCGALSLMGNDHFKEGFGPFLPGTELVTAYDLNELEEKLKEGDVAALFVEPVQGKGVKYPKDDYFQKAQEMCHKYGALFICDEVQTGLGRTGKLFGFQHWNLDPDIITLAKALSGGYVPAAAFVTRRSIYQKVFSRMDRCVVHSSTFGRNNLAMACGLATLHVIDRDKIVENSAFRGEELMRELKKLQEKHEIIKEVRGKGLMMAIEFHEPKSLKLKLAWKAIHAVDKGLFAQMIVTSLLQKHRILTHVAGHQMDVLKILPPLVIGENEVRKFVDGIDSVLNDLHTFPGPMWDFGKNLVQQALSNKSAKKAEEEEALEEATV